jgi:hypothetical protein
VYAFKKENLSLFLQDFFNDLVMPQLMKDLTPEHIMRFTGSVQELEKLDKAASEVYANDIIKERILNGDPAYQEDLDGLKEKAVAEFRKLGESRFVKIKDAFYDDAEFEFDFLVTNEQEDPSQIAQNTQAMLMAYNPQAMADPRFRLIWSKFAEKLGIGQGELEMADQQATEQMQAQPLPANPMQNGNKTQTAPLTA